MPRPDRTDRRVLAAFALGLALHGPVAAQEPAVFDFHLRGIRAGTLSFAGQDGDGRYAVTGRLESSGLVAMIRKVRYDGEVSGRTDGTRFTPERYVERADTGRRQSEAVMEYRRGVPQVKTYNPPREAGDGGLDPATQGGTVDPLTAMYAALRDVPQGQECNVRLVLFDGKRRSQVVVGPPQPAEGGVACAGEYRRLEGFSEKDMAEKTRFPFTAYLAPDEGGMMRVTQVRMDSLYGKATLTRR
jgi:hypothetical protein